MRLYAIILVLVCSMIAQAALPPLPVYKSPRLKQTSGSKSGALDRPAYRVPPAPKIPRIGMMKSWDPVGPWPQFITYEIEVYTNLNILPMLVKTTNTFFSVASTSGIPMQIIGRIRSWDVALPNPSAWSQ